MHRPGRDSGRGSLSQHDASILPLRAPYTREALGLNFAGLPEDEVRQMTSLGAIDVYGFDAAELQTVTDRIGPSVMEVAEPLSASDLPAQTNPLCPTFLDARILVAD